MSKIPFDEATTHFVRDKSKDYSDDTLALIVVLSQLSGVNQDELLEKYRYAREECFKIRREREMGEERAWRSFDQARPKG